MLLGLKDIIQQLVVSYNAFCFWFIGLLLDHIASD